MELCFSSGRGDAGVPAVSDAGIGDHDIEVRDGVSRKARNSSSGVSGGERIDLHDDDLAAGAWDDGLDSSGLGCVAYSCDYDVVGTQGVLGNKTETNT